jgi:hypothetical protein
MTSFKYESVTPDAIQTLVQELRAAGSMVTNPTTNGWEIKGHGVMAQATYDPTTAILQVDIISKPFFVPDSFINTGILKALGRA